MSSAAAQPEPLDRDRDGASDDEDACPDEPEDCDGYQDEDGCPEPDNDGDRVVDVCDVCPGQPETYNGYEDEDGCPDAPPDPVGRGEVRIVPQVRFSWSSAKPVQESRAIIESVAQLMKDRPDVEVVGIVGHARAGEPHPGRLGERRARAVEQALEKLGVAASRLEVHSLGSAQPIADPRGPAAARNQRVEFKPVRLAGREFARWTPKGYEVVVPPAPPEPSGRPRPKAPPCRPGKRLPPELHKRCAGRSHAASR